MTNEVSQMFYQAIPVWVPSEARVLGIRELGVVKTQNRIANNESLIAKNNDFRQQPAADLTPLDSGQSHSGMMGIFSTHLPRVLLSGNQRLFECWGLSVEFWVGSVRRGARYWMKNDEWRMKTNATGHCARLRLRSERRFRKKFNKIGKITEFFIDKSTGG